MSGDHIQSNQDILVSHHLRLANFPLLFPSSCLSQGTRLEGGGKAGWELKVFVEKERRSLTSNQHSSSSSYPNYQFTQEDLKFLHRKRHCSIALSSIAQALEVSETEQHLRIELLRVALKIPENPDFIQTCHSLLPQVLRFLSRKFPFSGENPSHFL